MKINWVKDDPVLKLYIGYYGTSTLFQTGLTTQLAIVRNNNRDGIIDSTTISSLREKNVVGMRG